MMRRSAIITNHDNAHEHSSATTTDELNPQYQKRSLEDYGFSTNSKRRRHLSPQNANIDMPNNTDDDDHIALASVKKKARTKSKNQSILNSSMETMNDTLTPRKTSSRHTSSSLSSQQMNEIGIPTWERICPNIDQILSNKHTQSGVFAHEVQLVQQELEALLSMSIVRENILKDLSNPSINTSNTIRSKIRKHQEAERIYSTKKISKKPLPSSANHQHHHHHHHQRQNGTQVFLDRQVALAPILGARIDQIWSDISTYSRQISSNDISSIENLVEFHEHLSKNLEQLKSGYTDQSLDPSMIADQLNEENYEQLTQISQTTPLIKHYVDRSTIGAFQTKLYEHIGQTSPVYKTPISSPMHGKILGNHYDHGAELRTSPRLHPNDRLGTFTLPNLKLDDDGEGLPSSSSSMIKSKKKSKLISSPSSAVKFHQRLQLVQDYLVDQHPSTSEAVRRQLFNDMKATKRKPSTSSSQHEPCTDVFQSKLSTLISLFHECTALSSRALRRARLQSDNEQASQQLNTIERDLESLIEKVNTTGGSSNHSSKEKAFQNLAQMLTDWTKYEDQYHQQLEELFPLNQ